MLRTEVEIQRLNTTEPWRIMEDVCRLCCSSSFVRNDIFESGEGLHDKMALYMPVQVVRGDRLPQRVCDVCRRRVLELHHFCSEALIVQHRLQTVLLASGVPPHELVGLAPVKRRPSPVPAAAPAPAPLLDRGTQTEPELPPPPPPLLPSGFQVSVKQEPLDPATPKVEQEDDHTQTADAPDLHSDDSDNISLKTLKKKKRKRKHKKEKPSLTNGDFKDKKRKKKMKEWEMLMNALPAGTTIGVVGDGAPPVQLKQESDSDGLDDAPLRSGTGSEHDTYTCCVCLDKFSSQAAILDHYMSHREPEEAEAPAAPPAPDERCPRCGKALDPAAWPEHWRRHWQRDRRPFRCTLCELSFRKPQQILKHGLTHERPAPEGQEVKPPSKRYVCDHCTEEFVYMRYLLAHRSRAHPGVAHTPLALRCASCSRQFRHLNSLRRHQRAHAGERTHLCNMCGKALSSREHLKFHIRIHTGYKPNVCNTCGKGFAKKCNLTLHERTHSGEKPHVCGTCHKGFSQRSTLVIHERYHSGARPYVCSLCGRGFVAKGLLSMHLKTTCV